MVFFLGRGMAIYAAPSAPGELQGQSSEERPHKPLRLSFSNIVETGLQRWNNANKDVVNHASLGVALTSRGGARNSVEVLMSKRLDGNREAHFSDVKWGLSGFSRNLGSGLSVGGSLGLVLPLSASSRKSRSLAVGVQVAPALGLDAKNWLPGLKAYYVPSATRYFHRYTQQVSGASNSRYALGNQLLLYYSITEKLTLGLDQTYTRRWSYRGHSRDSFGFGQTLSYNFAENWQATVGHFVGGSALAINGRDSDVRFFDSDISRAYIGLGWAL